MSVEATILITSKNRKDDLRTAIKSCIAQAGEIEVLVISDGSTDGTPEMVRAEFPSVRLEHFDESKGLIYRRNQGAELARGPVVFSIDDDAEFTDPQTVRATLAEMAVSPRIGAVAMPYIDVSFSPEVLQRASDPDGIWVIAHYRGTAHALRRDVFLSLGGYRSQLIQCAEEPEYCIRMMGAGYVTCLGRAAPINHYESPKRSYARQYMLNARNHVLFAWYHCPLWFLPVQCLGSNLLDVKNAIPKKSVWPVIKGICSGYVAAMRDWKLRRAVPSALYKLFRELRSAPGRRLEEMSPELPPLRPLGAAPAAV